MRPVLIAIGALLAMVMAAPAAHAQLSETGGPVSYSANNLEYFDGDRRLVLTVRKLSYGDDSAVRLVL